jgi:excisionase family DNA binding protein
VRQRAANSLSNACVRQPNGVLRTSINSSSPNTLPTQIGTPAAVTAEPPSLVDRIQSFQRALTPDELADLLRVSRVTIIRRARRGTIPAFRIGACVRFDPKAIACWLKKHGVN